MSDSRVKIAISREEYHYFLDSLFKGQRYIQHIGETIVDEVVDSGLLQVIDSEATKLVETTIELVDESGLRDSIGLQSALSNFLSRENLGTVTESYLSERLAVYDGNIRASAVPEIAQSIGTIEHVQITPQVVLVSEFDHYPVESPKLSSAVSLENKTELRAIDPSLMPCACAIDSGVNRDHVQLQRFIAGTLDLTTNAQLPCDDIDGHGSMVSGIIIRGGDLVQNSDPLSTVAMVKGFANRTTPVMDTLTMIGRAIGTFGEKTKVYNLSFASNGPDPSRTRALDELIYSRGIMIVACAGNISQPKILQHLNAGEKYPNYLLQSPVFYPGDADNALTVGSYASKPSNWVHEDYPSPFTRTGTSLGSIKPDLVENGGNFDKQGSPLVTGLSGRGRGVISTGLQSNSFEEGCGTSFSAPAIASLVACIYRRYSGIGPYLAKAMVISSTQTLRDSNGVKFSPLIQGHGVPDHNLALNAFLWNVSYLLQGTFEGTKEEYHGYTFKFPPDADRLTITFVTGKPPGSRGFFSIGLKKAGVKPTTVPHPTEFVGSSQTRRHISTTWQETHKVTKGGKGNWWIGVYPHFDKLTRSDKSLKYGCVVTVESSKGLDVYSGIARWVGAIQRSQARVMEPPMVALQDQAQEVRIPRVTRRKK
jgi:hypothetical protein